MWFLSMRHLLSRKRQTFFIILGIVLGTSAYITISGMMIGFQSYIIDQLVNNDSHVRIKAREDVVTPEQMKQVFFPNEAVGWVREPSGRKDDPYISNPVGWFNRLDDDNDVEAYTEQMQMQAIATHGHQSSSARIVGMWPEKQIQVSSIKNFMLKGNFEALAPNSKRVVIGEMLAKKLGVNMGGTIRLTTGQNGPKPFQVAGIFRLGVKSLDESMIFAPLNDVQQLNQSPSRITDIAIRLRNVEMASLKADVWSFTSGEKVQSWDQSNEGVLSVFKTQNIVRNFMTISIILVAGFGIYNILSMAVTNKKKEIAILRSMGFLSRDILKLFLWQGIVLGILGGIVGVAIGYAASRFVNTIEVSAARGLSSGNNTMMMSYDVYIYVRAMALAVGSAVVASLLPAYSASKLGPIEIIRGEGN